MSPRLPAFSKAEHRDTLIREMSRLIVSGRGVCRRGVAWGGRILEEVAPTDVQRGLQEAVAGGHKVWGADGADAYCGRCGATMDASAVTEAGCLFCVDQRLAWEGLTRLGAYVDPLAEWVRVMKFRRGWVWAQWFAGRLAERVPTPVVGSRTVVCPVPMFWLRRWHRGYNQADLLAARLARMRGWPLGRLLYRTRHTMPQTRVAPSQRPSNVARSFAMHRVDLTGWDVLLVDDVKTTGSTLTPCARLLQAGGARSVRVAVIAVADPRGGDFSAV